MRFVIERSFCSTSSETDKADPIVLIKLLHVSTSPQHSIDDILIKTEIDFDTQVKNASCIDGSRIEYSTDELKIDIVITLIHDL